MSWKLTEVASIRVSVGQLRSARWKRYHDVPPTHVLTRLTMCAQRAVCA